MENSMKSIKLCIRTLACVGYGLQSPHEKYKVLWIGLPISTHAKNNNYILWIGLPISTHEKLIY